MSLIAEPTYEEITNLFTNPNLLGDGTRVEVFRNLFTDPGAVLGARFTNFVGAGNVATGTARPSLWSKSGSVIRYLWSTRTVNLGSAGPNLAAITLLPLTQYTISWRFATSRGTSFKTQAQTGGTINASSGTISTVPTEPSKMWVTFTTGPAGERPANTRVDGDGLGIGDGAWIDISEVDLYLGPYQPNRFWFSGSYKPNDMVQPEDFMVVWSGPVNNSDSVMTGENVRETKSNNLRSIVSTKNGKPAIRQIPTGSVYQPGQVDSFTVIDIPVDARLKGTALATVILDTPLLMTAVVESTRTRELIAYTPQQRSSRPANVPGASDIRFVYNNLTSLYVIRLYHSGGVGSGELWWTDVSIFKDEPVVSSFSGSTPELYYKNVRVFPEWVGEPNLSPSRFRYYTRHDIEPSPTTTKWDAPGERRFETGVDRGMLYSSANSGVPWNGLTEISEKPTGGEPTPYFIDGVKYLNWPLNEDFQANLSAFTYPREFEPHDGMSDAGNGLSIAHQPRRPFGLSYRTRVGNDIDGVDHGYKIHLVYNVLASPSERANRTLNTDPEAIDFSWVLTTTPVKLSGKKASAHLVIDSTRTDPYLLRELEEILYGTEGANPRLPTGQEILDFFDSWQTLIVIDYGDGTFTASGPDDVVYMTDPTTFVIDWASAVYISNDTYTLRTL